MKVLSKRWKGTTAKQRTEQMRELGKRRQAKMSDVEKNKLVRKMIKGRGHWEGKGVNRVYVRNVK